MGETTEAVIVGAGPAGLATAACLRREGVAHVLLERSDAVGNAWRHHYARLHLHTTRDHSALPYTRMPASYPTYPSRQQVVDYLDAYAAEHGIEARLNTEVTRVARDGDGWLVEASDASWRAKHVVIATGYNRVPRIPEWPGVERFGGRVLHSRDYDTGADFAGQRVLVVGCGNSGAEIALDLCEQNARMAAICIRGPINVVPRDLFGVPAQVIGILSEPTPPAVTDLTMKALSYAFFGDLSRWGIHRKRRGPLRQILEEGSIPLIDVGTIARIKAGELLVVPAIERFTEDGAVFADGSELHLDAVVLATGYTTGLESLLDAPDGVLDARGYPKAFPPEQLVPGLHFVGFANVPTGLLRHIRKHAMAAAEAITGAA